MLYSKATHLFYALALRASFEAAGTLPDDVVQVEEDDFIAATACRAAGGAFSFSDGVLTCVEVPVNCNAQILAEIADLESTATPRRIREAALGTDDGWLLALDEQISELRKKLT